jgi:hypothetical protein
VRWRRREFLGLAAAASLRAQPRPQAEAFYQKVVGNGNLKKYPRGEDFCWHAAYDLNRFVDAYLAWKDTSWLDWGVRYYEFLVERMDTGPDGYRGWIGPYEYDESVWCDVHVGDAILLNGMVGFAEVVLADPALAAKYGESAHKYVGLARRDLFEKWDARGTWTADGPYGGYRSWNRYGAPGNLRDWTVRDDIRNSNLSLPFNKQDDLAAVALKLHRITGEEKFRDRAARIFAFQKSRFQLVDDHYAWNYWEPYGAPDVDLAAGKTKHWVGVHPDRPYQQGEVAHMVDAYETGVVFDERDMRRILNTNLKVMWNGSVEAPAFRNSNAGLPGANPKNTAGALWPALAEFDDTVRRLRSAQLAGARGVEADIDRAGLQQLPAAGFERRNLKGKPAVFDFPLAPCVELRMAAALPMRFEPAAGTLLACETLVRGAVEVAQYSADGRTKLAVLHSFDRGGQMFYRWSGAKTGAYRVRFTFSGAGYREVPVVCL